MSIVFSSSPILMSSPPESGWFYIGLFSLCAVVLYFIIKSIITYKINYHCGRPFKNKYYWRILFLTHSIPISVITFIGVFNINFFKDVFTDKPAVFYPSTEVTCSLIPYSQTVTSVTERSSKYNVVNFPMFVEYECGNEKFFYQLSSGEMIQEEKTFYRSEQ